MRRKRNYKRPLAPDHKYNDAQVAKFINNLMLDGKKSVAEAVVYGAFDIVAKKSKKEPLDVFKEALKNASPTVEVKSRRIGGANYQIPREVYGDRKITLAMRWIIDASRKKSGKAMENSLAEELLAAINNEGDAVAKKIETHKIAQANKAFAHFSW